MVTEFRFKPVPIKLLMAAPLVGTLAAVPVRRRGARDETGPEGMATSNASDSLDGLVARFDALPPPTPTIPATPGTAPPSVSLPGAHLPTASPVSSLASPVTPEADDEWEEERAGPAVWAAAAWSAVASEEGESSNWLMKLSSMASQRHLPSASAATSWTSSVPKSMQPRRFVLPPAPAEAPSAIELPRPLIAAASVPVPVPPRLVLAPAPAEAPPPLELPRQFIGSGKRSQPGADQRGQAAVGKRVGPAPGGAGCVSYDSTMATFDAELAAAAIPDASEMPQL